MAKKLLGAFAERGQKDMNKVHEISEALVKGPAHQVIDPLKKGKK